MQKAKHKSNAIGQQNGAQSSQLLFNVVSGEGRPGVLHFEIIIPTTGTKQLCTSRIKYILIPVTIL